MNSNPSQLTSATATSIEGCIHRHDRQECEICRDEPTKHVGPVIHFPTEEEEQRKVQEALERMRKNRNEMREAARLGRSALCDLINALRENHVTGQPYKIRALLYSLWNGKPASLVEVVCLDHNLRQSLCQVIAGFGYEDAEVKFFYAAIQEAFTKAGLFEWFLEEGEKKEGA